MSQGTTIEWTQATWNPVTGCDRVSSGCDHCYALTLAKRLKAMGSPRYQRDGKQRTSGPGFGITLHRDKVLEPLSWRKPKLVFVNSMSDLFHSDVPEEFILGVFGVMTASPQHTYQVLTKRPRRMRSLLGKWSESVWWLTTPPPNVWLGVSIEDQEWADRRIPLLLKTPAAVRFLSCEPLLGPINLAHALTNGHDGKTEEWPDGRHDHPVHTPDTTSPVHWVIVGGESGPKARPMHAEWVRSLRDQCVAASVPFFFKQWGGRTPKAGGRMLDERTWDDLPLIG